MAAAALVVAIAAACGDVVTQVDAGGDGDGDGDIDAAVTDPCTEAIIPIDAISECYARALCTAFTECQPLFSAFVDEAECREYLDDIFAGFEQQIDKFVAAINAGAVDYDGAQLAACLAGVDQCDLSADACDFVFSGNTASGATCFDDIECGRGGDCNVSGMGTGQCPTGTCVLPVGIGSTCGGIVRCEAGLSCVTDAAGNASCVDGALGSPCNSAFDCDSANTCGAANTCIARLAEGAVCSISTDCLTPLDCVNMTCQRPDTAGDPCNGTCLGSLFCDTTSTCRSLPTVGQSCAASNRCLGATLFCTAGVCRSLSTIGQTCDNDTTRCMPDLWCDLTMQTCAAQQANGASCNSTNECESHVCEANRCETFDVCYGP